MWTKVMVKDGVDLYTFKGHGNQTGVMGKARVPYCDLDVMQAVSDPDIVFKANPFGEKMQVLERVDEDTVVVYMKIKGMFVVSARDFVFYNKRIRIEDVNNPDVKHNAMIGFSIDHKDAPEPPKNTVRAEIIVAGWILEKIDEENTLVTNFGINDLKGSMPKFVINASASTHSGLLLNLIKQLDLLKEKGLLHSQINAKS